MPTKKSPMNTSGFFYKLAPAVGFEPTTKWLTATYSTIELRRNRLKAKKVHEKKGKSTPCRMLFKKPVFAALSPAPACPLHYDRLYLAMQRLNPPA
jgi:hypothetical protein